MIGSLPVLAALPGTADVASRIRAGPRRYRCRCAISARGGRALTQVMCRLSRGGAGPGIGARLGFVVVQWRPFHPPRSVGLPLLPSPLTPLCWRGRARQASWQLRRPMGGPWARLSRDSKLLGYSYRDLLSSCGMQPVLSHRRPVTGKLLRACAHPEPFLTSPDPQLVSRCQIRRRDVKSTQSDRDLARAVRGTE